MVAGCCVSECADSRAHVRFFRCVIDRNVRRTKLNSKRANTRNTHTQQRIEVPQNIILETLGGQFEEIETSCTYPNRTSITNQLKKKKTENIKEQKTNSHDRWSRNGSVSSIYLHRHVRGYFSLPLNIQRTYFDWLMKTNLLDEETHTVRCWIELDFFSFVLPLFCRR